MTPRRELLASGGIFFEVQDGRDDLFHRDFLHAAEVDRALAKEAGTAFHFLSDDLTTRTARTGERGFGGSENGHKRGPDKVGEVHGAGVIGEESAQLGEEIHEFAERGFSCEVGDMSEAI